MTIYDDIVPPATADSNMVAEPEPSYQAFDPDAGATPQANDPGMGTAPQSNRDRRRQELADEAASKAALLNKTQPNYNTPEKDNGKPTAEFDFILALFKKQSEEIENREKLAQAAMEHKIQARVAKLDHFEKQEISDNIDTFLPGEDDDADQVEQQALLLG